MYEKMKKEVMEMMEKKYNSPPKPLQNISDEDIEKKGFMRASHAAAIRECCRASHLRVSFLEAGKDTIDRIKAGNPCKSQSIANKTIKYDAGIGWNYTPPLGKDAGVLLRLRGLVGFPRPLSNTLAGVWTLSDTGTEEKITLDTLDARNTLDTIDTLQNLRFCFTGDYAMHDLIQHDRRIRAGTYEERDAIGLLNGAILNADLDRKANAEKGRAFLAAYAPIRHVAQTSFMDYLLGLGQTGESRKAPETVWLPHDVPNGVPIAVSTEGKIVTITKHIVMFEDNGTAYLLNSTVRMYQYYKDHGLAGLTPFYYFFNDLRNIRENEERLNEFSASMNRILAGSLKEIQVAASR
jgi:hypothetical protein